MCVSISGISCVRKKTNKQITESSTKIEQNFRAPVSNNEIERKIAIERIERCPTFRFWVNPNVGHSTVEVVELYLSILLLLNGNHLKTDFM